MDGETLQDRIYAGMGISANKAGRPYSQYRSPYPIDPISDSNLRGEINCLFAAEKKFEVPNKYKIPTRYLYADGRELAQRDILVGPYGRFFVGDMQPNLPMQVVWCNDMVSIVRISYLGTTQIEEPVASGMPCFRQLKKIDQKKPEFGVNTAATPIGEWFLFIPIDWSLVQQGDIITDSNGKLYTLDTIDPTEIGTVLTMRQADS
jgi:hypothetical protein